MRWESEQRAQVQTRRPGAHSVTLVHKQGSADGLCRGASQVCTELGATLHAACTSRLSVQQPLARKNAARAQPSCCCIPLGGPLASRRGKERCRGSAGSAWRAVMGGGVCGRRSPGHAWILPPCRHASGALEIHKNCSRWSTADGDGPQGRAGRRPAACRRQPTARSGQQCALLAFVCSLRPSRVHVCRRLLPLHTSHSVCRSRCTIAPQCSLACAMRPRSQPPRTGHMCYLCGPVVSLS